jgi:AraC family transcriptional regulator
MPVTTLLQGDGLRVIDYRCEAGPHDRPFAEVFDSFSVAYVRRGSFGCVTTGRTAELVAGSDPATGAAVRCHPSPRS